MPEAFPPTVAEREAELVALQNAFDEYIASSRELEEELDAELAKLRKYKKQEKAFALHDREGDEKLYTRSGVSCHFRPQEPCL